MMRAAPYFFYLWLIAMHEVFLRDLTSLWGININVAALMVLGVALYKTETVSAWFGFLAGLVAFVGLPNENLLGVHTLSLAALGVAAYNVRQRLNLDSLYSRLFLVFFGVLAHNIFILLLSGVDNVFLLFLTKALPGAVYTSIIAWVFFLLKDKKVTLDKLKSNF